MTILNTLQSHLGEHVGRADLRLFEAILKCAPSNLDASKPILSLDKDQVLNSLREIEGKDVGAVVVRSRIRNLNAAFTAIGRNIYKIKGAIMTISSRKKTIVLDLPPAAAKFIETGNIKTAVAEAAQQDNVTHESDLVESRIIALPTYQVMISHGWENERVENILDEFKEALEQKLSNLPDHFGDQFSVGVWFDRQNMNARARLDKQIDAACEESEFAVFMTSDKWSKSKLCQREYKHFERRNLSEDEQPFILIQLSGNREDLNADLRDRPCLPGLWESEFKTLLALWEKGDEDDKDDFTTYVRDEICKHLKKFGGPGNDPEPTGQKKLRDICSMEASINRDILEENAIENQLLSYDKKSDERTATEDGTPALPYLTTWANDPEAKNRIVAILGGFGMGKTVTVQRLADKLSRASEGPTPIYLDFRRLIPASERGKPIISELSDIILKAIGRGAGKRLDAGKLIDMIQSEPCVVILDGLDEIGNRIGRAHASALYRQLLELIPREVWQVDLQKRKEKETPDWDKCSTRIIVTCRTHFFRSLTEEESTFDLSGRGGLHLRESIQTWYMAPLSLDLIEQLFIKSLGHKEGQKALQTIQKVHDLLGLAQRPIMARYISEIAGGLLHRHKSGEVINIATIYEELFERALERDSEKVPMLSPSDRVAILKALAFHLHERSASELDVSSLESWFDEFADNYSGIQLILKSEGIDARGLLQTELRNASFLVRVHKNRFVFAHTSFFEYFLGRALCDAVLAGNVSAFAANPLSRETIEFCFAVVKQKNLEDKFNPALTRRIISNDSLKDRKLIWRLIQAGGNGVVAPPPGANLSEFNFRDLQLKPGTVWDSVNLDRAVLTGLKACNIVFRNVSFENAFIGDAQFEDCHFNHCSGRTRGAESTRVWQGHCDSASESIFEDTLFRWPGGESSLSLPVQINCGHSNFIESVAFTPDGATVLTGGLEGTARLWDAQTGTEIHRFEGGKIVQSITFAPDGATVLTGGNDGTARLWDVQTGAEIRRFEGGGIVQSIAFAPDGATVFTGGLGGTARLWNTQTGAEIRRFEGHGDDVQSVAFAPDGATVLTSGLGSTARLWDAQTGAEIRRFEGHGDWVRSVAFAPDGATVLTGGDDGIARLWDAQTGTEIRRFEGHRDYVRSVAFAPDGATVLTGGNDGTARLWDAQTGTEIRRFEGGEMVRSIAFAPDGATVLTGGLGGIARLWDTQTGAEIRRFEGGRMVLSVAFAPDGATVLTGGNDGTARLWDAQTGAEIRRFEGGGIAQSIAFAPDGATVLTGGLGGTARLWNTQTGAEIRRFEGGRMVLSVAFAPDGATVLTGGNDGTARLWDAQTGAEIRRFEGGGITQSIAFAPDGATVLTGSHDGTARLWNTQTGAEIRRFEGHGDDVRSVAFAPDGATVLTGSHDGTARLWNTQTGAEIRCFEGGEMVRSVAFAPDGATVLTGGLGGTARLWDAQTGAEIRRFEGERMVLNVAFAPDGATVLTGGLDGRTRLWNFATGMLEYEIIPLPDSWVVRSSDGKIIRHGPNLWRYAYSLIPSNNGLPRVTVPHEERLLRLQVS